MMGYAIPITNNTLGLFDPVVLLFSINIAK